MNLTPNEMASFDIHKPENYGRPLFFNLETHIKAIVQMICSDEIEIAMDMIKRVPAWYREKENYPAELKEIENTLYRQMYDSFQYSNESAIDTDWTKDTLVQQYKNGYYYPRVNILAEEIKKLNNQGVIPWICEIAPSHGGMAIGLLEDGFKFKYYAQNLNSKATDKLREWLPEHIWIDKEKVDSMPICKDHKFLVAYECLEHSYREKDIEQAAKKIRTDWDRIFLSVPYGCLYGGLPNWNTRPLGHIRGYTSGEFVKLADEFFPGYNWTYFKHHSQVLMGAKQ